MMALEIKPLPEAVIDQIIARHPDRTGDVLAILEEIQESHPLKFLPQETHDDVAQKIGVARSQIESVITFYAFFNLKPQGRHTVTVCRGTACHTRGSRALLERVKLQLGLQEARDDADKLTLTTPDRRFTIRTVACFGQCALAPVVEVDHAIRGHVKEQALIREVEGLRKDGAR